MVVHMRHTRAHTGNRRSHHAIAGRKLGICAKCASPVRSHYACANCGTYKGREVVNTLRKIQKKEAKRAKESKG